jgi:hypothetical protein
MFYVLVLAAYPLKVFAAMRRCKHKVDMRPFGSVVISDCQRDLCLGLSHGTNHSVSWVVQHISWLVDEY